MSTAEAIGVLIAHGDDEVREALVHALSSAPHIQVVGAVGDSETAVALARKLAPDILLVDYDLPGRWTPIPGQGIETTETVASILPGSGVILLASDIGPAVLRRAIVAGARQFLQVPIDKDELIRTIQQVHASARRTATSPDQPAVAQRPQTTVPRGKVVAVFSPRGGVGCTTIAANTAIALRQSTGRRVALVDGVLPFGDIGVFLDLSPARSIGDLATSEETLDADTVDAALSHHNTGIDVLLAPQRPEVADLVSGDLVRHTIESLRQRYDYVVIDTWSALDERVLAALDAADTVILVLSLTLSAIRSAKTFLQVSTLLQFPPDKVTVIATRIGAPGGLTNADLEDALGHPVDLYIPNDTQGTLRAINEGKPIMLSGRESPVALAIRELARGLVTDGVQGTGQIATATITPESQGRLRKIFGRAS